MLGHFAAAEKEMLGFAESRQTGLSVGNYALLARDQALGHNIAAAQTTLANAAPDSPGRAAMGARFIKTQPVS